MSGAIHFRRRPLVEHDNPWGLTAREAEVMTAICRLGHYKAAARELGLSIRTLEGHTRSAREKMGVEGKVHGFLTWDRFQRGQQ